MCDMCKGGTLSSKLCVSISVVILCVCVAFYRYHLERVVHIIFARGICFVRERGFAHIVSTVETVDVLCLSILTVLTALWFLFTS